MKLYLKQSAGAAKKLVGWRTPGKFYKINKGYVLHVNEATEVPDDEAELILAQNPHLATTESEAKTETDVDETDIDDSAEEIEPETSGDTVVLQTLRELSDIPDLMQVNMKVLRGYAANIGVEAPVTKTKKALVDDLNNKCAELADRL